MSPSEAPGLNVSPPEPRAIKSLPLAALFERSKSRFPVSSVSPPERLIVPAEPKFVFVPETFTPGAMRLPFVTVVRPLETVPVPCSVVDVPPLKATPLVPESVPVRLNLPALIVVVPP